MEALIDFLLQYGYAGMFASAFLAGSFLPFSSEAVLTGLRLAGLNVWTLSLCATLGNLLGGILNYGIGHMGHENWIYLLFKVKPERLEQSKHFVRQHGAWMGLLAWLPILGSVVTIALGLLRVNFWKSTLAMFLGKAVRYIILALILEGLL